MNKIKTLLAVLCIGTAFSFTIQDLSSSALYPGGRSEMDKYLRDSLRYPEAELRSGKEEIVRVTFEVTETGTTQNVSATSLFGNSSAFDEEARRLILAMPKWEAGTNKRGKPCSTFETAVVRFILPDSVIAKFPLTADTTKYPVASKGEVMPRFQGGENGFQQYLKWAIRYPQVEMKDGREGTVYIYFEVTPRGAIENVRCVKGVPGASGLDREAVRVISEMPRWVPGFIDGRPVKVSMTVPVRFTLQ
jgi:TonB family protein